MELKVVCHCGQKYKFDVDPVNRLMPFAVNCPVCGVDGTTLANALLAQQPAPPPIPAAPAPPAPPASGGGLRVNAAAAPVALPLTGAAAAPAPARPAPRGPAYVTPAAAKSSGEFNLGLGILGAMLGAGMGTATMFGLTLELGFKFPFFGLVVGALTGFLARKLYKGTDNTLAFFASGITLLAVGGSLLLLFGVTVGTCLSTLVSVSVAWRITSGG